MPLTERAARENLNRLIEDYERLTPDQRAGMTEASVVRQLIDRLLEEVLGWQIKEPTRYVYELHTMGGRPDVTLIPETGGRIYLEAKKLGAIKRLERTVATVDVLSDTVKPSQLALPGMAVDRTPEEQQAINYAFANNATWAILTNFEVFRLFNARRDWLVLSFETPYAYLHDFDLLWQLAYQNVIDGSLDVLSNQRHTEDVDRDYLSFINFWRERLARDILNRPGVNRWAVRDDGSIDLPTLRAVVQRYLDRLVIARFAEDHLVVPPGTLRQIYELRRENPYTFPMDQHLREFFRNFDDRHNSALFAAGVVDQASFSDDALMPLIEKLYEARYRAMPADILGNTYEQYLGKALVLANGKIETRDNLETRKKQGSYYTPQVIVRYIVDNSLGRWLYGTSDGKPDGEPVEGETRKTSTNIRDLRVLDSACGSGSFLIYAYEVLAKFYEGEIARLDVSIAAGVRILAQHDTTTPEYLAKAVEVERMQNELARIRDHYPRLILERHLYGVDLDPQAAEIAVVNLMMRAMERRGREKRLPLILNQNVKVGNGLIGVRADDPRMTEHADALKRIADLRARLVATPQGEEHDRIIAELEAESMAIRAVLDEPFKVHFSDLSRVRPFHWGAEFPEVFYKPQAASGLPLTPSLSPTQAERGELAAENSGFTIIVGNPPWEIIQPDLREFYAQFDPLIESRYTREQTEKRIAELIVEDRTRQSEYEVQVKNIGEASEYFRVNPVFQSQGKGKSATHKLFVERAYTLLQASGRLGYVVPSGIYSELGSQELREKLLNEGSIQYIFSFSNERFFFPGVDHRFKFALIGVQKGGSSDGFWATFRFSPRVAVKPDELPSFLANLDNLIYVRRESLQRFSPDSLSLMEFQTNRDYDVTERIYGSLPLLGENIESSWRVRLFQEFNFTSDRKLLNQKNEGIPFYEGKMIHQYNAFYAAPHFWIAPDKVASLSSDLQKQLRTYRVVHRRIARSTDEHTLISAIVPPNSACEINATVALIDGTDDERVKLYVEALFNSFVLDYVLRYKVSTTLNMFYLQQLPLPRLTAGHPTFDAIVPLAARLTCTRPEYADLWREVIGSEWTESSGATEPGERQRLRNEIDARVAHLYGLTRDEFDHILATFPLVFPETDAGRAKRTAVLAAYDQV